MSASAVVQAAHLHYAFGRHIALKELSLTLNSGELTGLIGPDGVGKSTLMSLLTGARKLHAGSLTVFGGDMRSARHREAVCPRIAYMPQGLGGNLYFTLTVEENLQYFARLFGYSPAERRRRIDRLTGSTGLRQFLGRPAGKLSGGMKQKLGLCCALIHDPDFLALDEPTTGVDPLARRQFWELIAEIRRERPALCVLAATAYMDEAGKFDRIVAMNDGEILFDGTPRAMMETTGMSDMDGAFIRLLPEAERAAHRTPELPPFSGSAADTVIEASDLSCRFGDFTAVDGVSFSIRRGEIFGFLGSNGCGKTTTMRMLTGLLPPTGGTASIFGRPVTGETMDTRAELGCMTQSFSLYRELTVRENLLLYARLCRLPAADARRRTREMLEEFHLTEYADRLPDSLPLGIRQRLSLAAAVIHHPRLLILDEPTSGVDPVERDNFWSLIIALSRRDQVTIFITTHFMNEAMRCDRISLMHAGKSLICGTPEEIIAAARCATLEEAFIHFRLAASPPAERPERSVVPPADAAAPAPENRFFSWRRCACCAWKEFLELLRDPIRASLALFGALLLMTVMGYGISMDVENLSFAVLDRDRSQLSTDYALNLAGSRYFDEKAPIRDHAELDRRLRDGELSMALEIPPGFGRDAEKGVSPEISVQVDGAMPMRSETVNGYVRAMHAQWLGTLPGAGAAADAAPVEVRYCYNPDVRSLPAMVPGVIPILLIMLPATLSALAVVREKETGSIINFYVTPLTRAEFLLGKQIPYALFAALSALLMVLTAILLFDVPLKGSALTLLAALLLYAVIATGMGLLASSVTRSQIAVIFLTMLATMLPATQLCGMITPVSAQQGIAKFIGSVYPTTYMLLICRGVFNKALGFARLSGAFAALLATAPIVTVLGILCQKKQE